MANGEQDLSIDIDNGTGSGGNKKTIIMAVVGAVGLVLITVVVMLLLLGGDSDSDPETPKPVKVEEMQYYSFAPLVVSFPTNSRQRYVQMGIDVAHRNAKLADVFKLHDPMIRSEMIRIINEQDFNTLRTHEGRVALQETLKKHLAGIIQREANEAGIEAVLFSNYVMQ